MNQSAVFGPFFAMILLTMVVWIYMYSRRIPFILKSNLGPEQLTASELARLSPPRVSNPSDNLKNLFEIPTIFYGMTLYLYAAQQADTMYLAGLWTFVAFRVFHSAVHCTVNIVALRFWLYFASTLALWFIAIRAALRFLGW